MLLYFCINNKEVNLEMKYTTPEMEIVRFEVEDVIVASGIVDECPTDDVQGGMD